MTQAIDHRNPAPAILSMIDAALALGLADRNELEDLRAKAHVGCIPCLETRGLGLQPCPVLMELDARAEANQHNNWDLRSDWIHIREAVNHMRGDEVRRAPDRFGFHAEAVAKSEAIIATHNLVIA